MELKKEIGNGLYQLRNVEGYSRQDFSEKAGISLNSYSNIENGKSLIKLDNLDNLLSDLSITLSDFFVTIKM